DPPPTLTHPRAPTSSPGWLHPRRPIRLIAMAAKPGTSPRGTPDVRTGEAEVHTFRSPTALVVWVVWLLFAVGNWIDIAIQGRDHLSVVAAVILLLATGVIY